MGIKSDHTDLLNELSGMQTSPLYALRRSVLQQAELLIHEQEREIAGLKKLRLRAMQAAGFGSLLSEILGSGALARHGDADLLERVEIACADNEAYRKEALNG